MLDWRVDGSYRNAMGLEIDLVDARTSLHAGRIINNKRDSDGVKLFNESGRSRLRIAANLTDYRTEVEEISAEDTERYTPKDRETGLWQVRRLN